MVDSIISDRRTIRRRRAVLLAVLLTIAALAAVVALQRSDQSVSILPGGPARQGASLETMTVESKLLGRSLDQLVVTPKQVGPSERRPLLVLLHGRGMIGEQLVGDGFFRALDMLGKRAPVVVAVNGDDHSYYHNRADGRWGDYVLREVIPAAIKRLNADPNRIAIGGMSMGGFGALEFARQDPSKFCAVGGHSAALWEFGGQTPQGAFDDAADFAKHDLLKNAQSTPRMYGKTKVWIDTGTRDPFRTATELFVQRLRSGGQQVESHIWPGDHTPDYWDSHMGSYMNFYAQALASCT